MESWNWHNEKNVGGVERYGLRLADNLVSRGIQTSIYTGPNYLDLPDGKICKIEGGNVSYPVFYHKDASHMLNSLEEDAISQKINLIELEGFYGIRSNHNIMERVLGLDVPLIFTSHNSGLLNKKNLYRELCIDFAKIFTDRVDAIICVSSKLGEDAIEFGFSPEKVHVIYNPIDEQVFHPVSETEKIALRKELGLPLDKKIIMYAGRISPEKGSEFLLRSWNEVHDAIPNSHLLVAGGIAPSTEKPLQDLFAQFKIDCQNDQTASFTDGFIKDEAKLAKYYQACDIFILPSPAEGLGNVLLEAMLCGKPCIISEIARASSGAGDLVTSGFNGTTFKDYTPEALITAIREIKNNMGTCGLIKAKNMGVGISSVTDEHIKLYQELVHGKPFSVAMIT